MPKFGQAWFAGELFGEKKLRFTNFKNSIHRVPLGFAVRRTIRISNWLTTKDTSKAITFRVRPGNGYYGAQIGERYQDKYRYFVPSSINNPEGERARIALKEAVSNWKTVLDEPTKKEYHRRAVKIGHLSGYNLYVKEYIQETKEMFIARGLRGDYDFVTAAFTADGAYHDLDLSSIIPANTKAILALVQIYDTDVGSWIRFKKKGAGYDMCLSEVSVYNADVDTFEDLIIIPDASQVIEYKVVATGLDYIGFLIKGWWL